MTPTKKLFAAITDPGFRVAARIEIKDEADAVQKTLQGNGIYFTTYEVKTLVADGREFKSEPENHSPRRFVGIGKIYSRDEVIASMEEDAKRSDAFSASIIRQVIDLYKSKPADSVHITGLERPGEFIEIQPGEKVFDKTGQQLWPVKKTPKPAPRNKPKFG